MSFYGNIKNTSQIQFQFDKIFESRADMDQAALEGTDNIFSGRFVLVKYDPNGSYFIGNTLLGFLNPSNNKIYLDNAFTLPLIYITFTHVDNPVETQWDSYYYFDGKFYLKLPDREHYQENNQNYYTRNSGSADVSNSQYVGLNTLVKLRDATTGIITETYYKCSGGVEGEPANWTIVLPNEDFSKYMINFNKDRTTYLEDFDPRGYDGTVWEKIYSEGLGRFILIARLNGGLFPSIELFPDPPSEQPKAPYIDVLSTEAEYRVHVPSMYGFQIKTVDQSENANVLSDQKGLINQITYNENTGKYVSNLVEKDVAIYFNKDGSNENYRKIDDSTANEILLEPTGESGRIYYDEKGNEIKKDLLELSIHVPALGNMIATGYDMLYGPRVGSGENVLRPRDIEWINGDRSVEAKKYGEDSSLNGKTYDLKTFAGVLNTMHERLGQIIVQIPNGESLPLANAMSPDLIYEQNNRFYRRGEGGSIEQVNELEYDYTEIDKSTLQNLNPFPANKYFSYPESGMTHLSNQIQLNNLHEINYYDPSPNVHYYLRNLNNTRFSKIEPNLVQYEQGKFYRLIGSDYIVDDSQSYPVDNTVYYWKFAQDPDAPGNENFLPKKQFTKEYKDDGSFYIRKKLNIFDTDYYEYIPYRESTPDPNNSYFTAVPTNIYSNKIYYTPNVFYIENESKTGFIPATTPEIQNVQYYYITFKSEVHYGLGNDNQVIEYREIDGEPQPITLERKPSGVQLYYLAGGHYLPYEQLNQVDLINNRSPFAIQRTYYTLRITGYSVDTLFLPNTYYSKKDNNYILASTWNNDVNTTYYDIIKGYHIIQNTQYFYMPNIYYYRIPNTDSFSLATEGDMIHEEYYFETAVYVDYDDLKQCPHGFKWNAESSYIPPSISLYRKTDVPDIKEIVGIANGVSTINGILLQLHKQFDFDNLETRNSTTFRGCLNELNDMLYRIKDIRPNHVLMVNDFGQIVSMDIPEGSILVGGQRGTITTMTLQQLKQALNAI